MKNFQIVLRSLFRKGQSNGIKILSLGVGLAMGLVLISKICFELSYDNFYPDSERIYQIQENISIRDESEKQFGQISGAVAPGMKDEIPTVEMATRFTYLDEYTVFSTPDKSRYTSEATILADSCWFDLLPRPMLAGNAKETLSRPMYALVSEKIAQQMGKGNDVTGQTFQFDNFPDRTITIGGVFGDMPENSHIHYDVILSLASISSFVGDGTKNWVGNDRYKGYVKLAPGTLPESLAPEIHKMQVKYQDLERLKKAGIELKYSLLPLTKLYSDTADTKRMTVMLGILAFALLFTAIMNYILIVVSSLVRRTREIAVHKCYGASGKNITGRMLSETVVHLILSLVVAGLLVLLFRGTIEELLRTSLGGLFSNTSVAVLAGVCVLVFLITGFIPSYLFVRIPVASAFRNYSEARRNWKRILLFVQFVAAAFLVTLLLVVGKQYERMINDNPGYVYNNTLICSTEGASHTLRLKALEELRRLPYVKAVSTGSELPINEASGNVVFEVGSDQQLFSFVDLYTVDADYLSLMEIPVEEGQPFSRETSDSTSVMVSRAFADKLMKLLNKKDGVVGETYQFSEHGNCTISGIYSDIRVGTISSTDDRPSVIFYTKYTNPYILVKLQELSSDRIAEVNDIIKNSFPDKNIVLTPYKTEMVSLYADSLRFRNAVLIGGLVTLLISLIGLMGYTNDEMIRRSKEIAVRKVNGATAANIIRLLSTEVSYMVIPATSIGVLCAGFAAEKWLRQFADKIALTPPLFIVGAVLVLVIVFVCVVAKSWVIANENPVKSIKSE